MDLVIVGECAYTPEEYARYRRQRDRINARRRERRATDSEYRERVRAYFQEYRLRHVDDRRTYHREWMRRKRAAEYVERPPRRRPVRVSRVSLHSLRCTGPTKATGCRCHKVTLYERAAA